jgi:hypothetical protein
MADVPAVKRKSRQSLKRQERQIVVNIFFFSYIKAKNPDKSVNWLAAETTATGISRGTMFNIQSEAAQGPLRTPNNKWQSRGTQSKSRKVKCNDFIRRGTRRKVHEFYFKNQPPTLSSLLATVNNDPDPHQISKEPLYMFF